MPRLAISGPPICLAAALPGRGTLLAFMVAIVLAAIAAGPAVLAATQAGAVTMRPAVSAVTRRAPRTIAVPDPGQPAVNGRAASGHHGAPDAWRF